VHARHPGWAQRSAQLDHHTYTTEQVIVAAHAYGSAKLLLRMQHDGRLRGLSSELGQRARTNSEQLLAITRTHGEWKRDSDKIRLAPGSVSITSGGQCHGSRLDITTGAVIYGVATEPLNVYEVKEIRGVIQVRA
jgi:cholesterol oxidase